MKQPTVPIAMLVTGLILACVLTGLTVRSQERDFCGNSVIASESRSLDACETAPLPPLAPANQPTPTLAPPRPEVSLQNGPSSNEVAKGQPVFLKVETDRNEIEVGWATP